MAAVRNTRSRAPTKKKASKRAASSKPASKGPRVVVEERWIGARFAAPRVRLGMTPNEVKECAGQPEAIVFGQDDHVEWQFGHLGADPQGAPTLFVTTLTFAAGRVVRIVEKMTAAP